MTSARRSLAVFNSPSSIALLALTFLLQLAAHSPSSAVDVPDPILFEEDLRPGETRFDQPISNRDDPGDPEVIRFGSVGEDGFAVEGGIWTWDHGGPDPWEGWASLPNSHFDTASFRAIDGTIWFDGDGGGPTENDVAAPILAGDGSAWLGLFENEADDQCWDSGLGYGNDWCQRLTSPVFEWNGIDAISLALTYFNDTELDFDYSRILLRRLPSEAEISLNLFGFSGQHGLAPNHPNDPPVGTPFMADILPIDFGGETEFQIVFDMSSDGGWSDEDGSFATEYSAFGVDDVSLAGGLVGGNLAYGFESSLEGWTAETCDSNSDEVGIGHLDDYEILAGCECTLSDHVLEFHDDQFDHPDEDWQNLAISNPVDLTSVPFGGNGVQITAQWEQYSAPSEGFQLFYATGWTYYPFTCEVTGEVGWSPFIANGSFHTLSGPKCHTLVEVGTDNGLPVEAEQVRFFYTVTGHCQISGDQDHGDDCPSNFTPIIDNVQILVSPAIEQDPAIGFEPGTYFQDGYPQSLTLDPDVPGRADVTRAVGGSESCFILGDSLVVTGPLVTEETSWESRLWFRLPRVGPTATDHASFTSWLDAVSDGRTIVGENAEFTWGMMDSVQVGTATYTHRFASYFREDDDDFDGGSEELSDGNEIIRDDVLYPGTAVEYFVTSNYISSPNLFHVLPDTSGQFFLEFEILPNYREDGGLLKFPCVLYIDAYNRGAEQFFESAFDALGLEVDRYDYADFGSNWKAPLVRSHPYDCFLSNNGIGELHLIHYRTLLMNTGSLSSGGFSRDWVALSDWLERVSCDGNTYRQGLILNGDSIAEILDEDGGVFLTNNLGATLVSGDLGWENDCIRLEPPAGGSAYGTSSSLGNYDYDVGSGFCTDASDYDVLGVATGTGNRSYVTVGSSDETEFSQVAHAVDNAANYRSVLDGVSWHHLSDRDPIDECVGDSAHIVTAIANELAAALEWIFEGSLPELTLLCEDEDCGLDVEVEAGPRLSNALFGNQPNPFGPRTAVRFQLARLGDVVLSVHDVTGRRVRSLADGLFDAGSHEIVWDGRDDAGERLAGGVYWSRFSSAGYEASSKMILLR